MQLQYLIREPKTIKNTNPVIILLHGYGSNEEDLFSFANELPEEYFVISVRAPYTLQPYGYAWYAIHFDADENKFSDDAQAIASRDIVGSFIDELIAKYPIDANEVTLIGFSQGTILSYAIALSYPEKIKSVVGLSGYFNEKIVTPNYKNNDFSKLQFFVSHGSSDQVIPVEWARKSIPEFEALKIPIIYKEYNVGHGVAPQNFHDFKNWLETTNK